MSKILVVEDDEDLREALAWQLISEDFEVIWAENGLEGSKLTNTEQPDLVITDIRIPEKGNGIELIKEIKKKYPVIKIIAMSGLAERDKEVALKAGADVFLPKDDELAKSLVITIKQVLDEK